MANVQEANAERELEIAKILSGRGGRSMNFPGVRQAYLDDPRTGLGANMLEQGQRTDPVAAGGWGWADGLARLGFGAFGGKLAGEQLRSYQDQAQQNTERFAQLYKGENAPQAAQQGQMAMPQPAQAGASVSILNDPNYATAQALSGQPPGGQPVNPRSPLSRALPGQGQTKLPQVVASPQTRGAVPPTRGTSSSVAAAGSVSPVSSGTARNTVTDFDRYDSPAYEPIENAMERKYGLPPGTLKNLRMAERSNANQVSETGARTVYQFIPGTRRLFKRKYGVDAWAGPRQSVEAAALHIKESLDAGRGMEGALRDYRGVDESQDPGWYARARGGTDTSISQGTRTRVRDRTTTSQYGPEDVNVTELPDEPVRPEEPEIDPIRISPRKLLAERLMAGGDAMFPLMMANLDAGMSEEADLNKQREENVAQMRNLGYQTDMQTYGSMRGNRYEQQLRDRQTDREAQYDLMKGEVEHENEIELENMRTDRDREIAKIRAAPDPFNPNDPRNIKRIEEHRVAGTAALTSIQDATRALTLAQKLDPGGWNAVKGVTAARSAFSDNIAEIEAIRNRLVLGMTGGKLGAGISNSDIEFLKKSTPISNDTPVLTIKRTASRLMNIAQRAAQYNKGAIDALGVGTFPQYASDWMEFESKSPTFQGDGNPIPFDQLVTYDDWRNGKTKEQDEADRQAAARRVFSGK